MSLLLDALNKADQERKRDQPSLGINSQHEHPSGHRARRLSLAIIAALAIALGALLAAIYWLGQRSAHATPASSAAPITAAPATAPTRKTAAQTLPETPALSALDSTGAAADINGEAVDVYGEPVTINNEFGINSEQDVANLYEQNAQAEALALAATAEQLAAQNLHAENINTENISAENTTAEMLPTDSANTAAPISIRQFANLPDLHDLPAELLAKIPSLNYSEHNYHPSGGYVKINGEIKHTNETLAHELVIDKILEDGMILHLNNYSFKMRALNSWVNM
jgi:general secretion pathway protein B